MGINIKYDHNKYDQRSFVYIVGVISETWQHLIT